MFRFRRRFLIWLGVVFGLPLIARALHSAADVLEGRQGPVPTVRRLHRVGSGAEYLRDTLGGRGGRARRS